MKKIKFIIFLFLLCFLSCNATNKSKKQVTEQISMDTITEITNLSISWDKIVVQSVPFTLPSNVDSVLYSLHRERSLENYYKFFNVYYSPTHELDVLFNGFTELQHKPWDYVGKLSEEQGHFFKRFPDVKNKFRFNQSI